MAQKDAIYNLILNLSKSEYSETIGGVQTLAKEIVELAKKTDRTSAEAQELSENIVAIGKDANFQAIARDLELLNVGDEIAAGFQRAERAAESIGDAKGEIAEVANQLTRAATAAERLDLADEQFDIVSRRAGLGGDAESGLRTIGGAFSAAGADKAGLALGTAAEIGAVAEALPRLKVALQSMPDVARFAAQSIGASGIGLIGALAALAVVTSIVQKEIEKQRKAAGEFIDAQTEVVNLLAGGAGTEEAKKRLEELQTLQTQQQENLDLLNTQYEEGIDAAREKFGILVDVADKFGASGQVEEFQQRISDSETALDGTNRRIELYNKFIEEGAFAANDAANAERELAQERNAAYEESARENIRFIEENAARQLELNRLIDEGTSESLEERLDGIRLEADSINKILGQLRQLSQTEAVTSAIADYEGQLSNLNSELVLFNTYAAPAIEAREQENAALQATQELINQRVANLLESSQEELEFSRFIKDATIEQVGERINAIQEERAALTAILPELEQLAPRSDEAARQLALVREELLDLNGDLNRLEGGGIAAAIANEQLQLTDEILDIEQERDDRIAEIRRESVDREAEILRSLAEELAKLEADAVDKRQKAYDDYNEKAREIEEDAFNKRLEIIKRYARDSTKAIGDRDALALEMAKQQKNESLDDLDLSIAEQRRKLGEGYAKQLQTIDQELNKQRATLQAKYNQQLSDLRAQTQAEINQERAKAQAEIQTRQNAYQQELALMNSFSTSGVSLIAQFATGAYGHLEGLVQRANALFSSTTNPATVGGDIASGLGLGGGSPTINVYGDNGQRIQEEISNILKDIF